MTDSLEIFSPLSSKSSTSQLIGTSRGPNDTLIITFSDRVTVLPTIPDRFNRNHNPVATYDLLQANKTLLGTPPTTPISRFTSPAQYHQASEQFVLIADNNIIMTWPTFATARPYDGHRWTIFCSEYLSKTKTSLYNVYPNPISPDCILILDNWGRLYNYPVPKGNIPPLLIKERPDIITSLKPQAKALSKTFAPIIFWAGPITTNYFVVATETGLICYSTSTLQIVDEICYPYAQQTTEAASDSRSNSLSTAQTVSSVSSIRVECTTSTPRFYNHSIPQAVLYQNGHLEIINFNTLLTRFELCYSRMISSTFVSPQSHVQVISPLHVNVITPTQAVSTEAAENKTCKGFTLELAYYTITAARTFTYALPQFSFHGANNQIIFANSFQIDSGSHSTRSVAMEICDNRFHAVCSSLHAPTLANSIGSATRDASVWGGIPLVAKKSTTQHPTDSPNSGKNSTARPPANPVPHYHTQLSTPTQLDEALNIKAHFQIPSISFPFFFSQPSTTSIIGDLADTLVQLDTVSTYTDNKDAILALSNQTLPILAPFSSRPAPASLSNQLSHIKAPTDLLMRTVSSSTQPLDQIIIANWPQYLSQCDDVERNALKRMLPRMYPYLQTGRTKLLSSQAQKRSVDGQALEQSTTNNQNSKIVESLSEISELPVDDFLFEFFSYCASWSDSTPTLLSGLGPTNSALNVTLSKATKCSCCINTQSPIDIPAIPIVLTTKTSKKKSPSPSPSPTPQQHLKEFVSSLVFEPCAWKALHASTLALTGSKTSAHLTRSSILFNTNQTRLNPQLALSTALSSTNPYCSNATKLSIAKPLSPLFTHLLFRECLRHLENACCANCPQMMYLLPLHILISNSMLNSALAVTCVNVALKKGFWGLINAIIPTSNISHSEVFLNVLAATLTDLAQKHDDETSICSLDIQVYEDCDDEEEEPTPAPVKSKPTKTAKGKKSTMNDIPSTTITEPLVEMITIQDLIAATPTDEVILPNDFAHFCDSSRCSCRASPLFSSQTAPASFSHRFPQLSHFIAHAFIQETSACVIYSLLASPITKPILVQQLRELDLSNVLTLLNILTLIFQSLISQTSLPSWLSCSECLQDIKTEDLLLWITMLIDSHAKEIMMAPHLLPTHQWRALDVFATLHTLFTTYCSAHPEMLHSASGMCEQLSTLKSLGVTKLSVAEPYTIQFTKF